MSCTVQSGKCCSSQTWPWRPSHSGSCPLCWVRSNLEGTSWGGEDTNCTERGLSDQNPWPLPVREDGTWCVPGSLVSAFFLCWCNATRAPTLGLLLTGDAKWASPGECNFSVCPWLRPVLPCEVLRSGTMGWWVVLGLRAGADSREEGS